MITLHHGTTRERATRLLIAPPDPDFVEPGAGRFDVAGGFSTAKRDSPDMGLGSPRTYAKAKAKLFPNEGDGVILEIEVPIEIVDVVRNHPELCFGAESGDIRFEPGAGLEELVACWSNIPKRILEL